MEWVIGSTLRKSVSSTLRKEAGWAPKPVRILKIWENIFFCRKSNLDSTDVSSVAYHYTNSTNNNNNNNNNNPTNNNNDDDNNNNNVSIWNTLVWVIERMSQPAVAMVTIFPMLI